MESGSYLLQVSMPDGSSYLLPQPVHMELMISAVRPSMGSIGGGTSVVIQGEEGM